MRNNRILRHDSNCKCNKCTELREQHKYARSFFNSAPGSALTDEWLWSCIMTMQSIKDFRHKSDIRSVAEEEFIRINNKRRSRNV